MKVHLLASTSYVGGQRSGVTACGRKVFKSLGIQVPDDEWNAVERLGGVRARTDRDFDSARPKDLCKRCMRAWGQGVSTVAEDQA